MRRYRGPSGQETVELGPEPARNEGYSSRRYEKALADPEGSASAIFAGSAYLVFVISASWARSTWFSLKT